MVIENLEIKRTQEAKNIKENGKYEKKSITIQASAGAMGGCATRFFCQPLDVLKIRFQVSCLSRFSRQCQLITLVLTSSKNRYRTYSVDSNYVDTPLLVIERFTLLNYYSVNS